MARVKRFTITIERALYERLLDVTDRRRPKLPKRYVVEVAITGNVPIDVEVGEQALPALSR